MASYRVRDGGRLRGSPQAIGELIARIQAKNGGVATPEMLLAAAKPKSSPAHKEFDWNDRVAAHAHRLNQARYILRTIEVVVERNNAEPVRTRAFVHLGDRHEFRDVRDVARDPGMMQQLLALALGELRVFKQKYERLSQLSDVFRAIDVVTRRIGRQKPRSTGKRRKAS